MDILRIIFFFQAEDGIRDLVRSRGLGDVYKRQEYIVQIPKVSGLQVHFSNPEAESMSRKFCPSGKALSLIHI